MTTQAHNPLLEYSTLATILSCIPQDALSYSIDSLHCALVNKLWRTALFLLLLLFYFSSFYFLPFLLLLLFCSCALVNKLWRKASLEVFPWHTVYKASFYINDPNNLTQEITTTATLLNIKTIIPARFSRGRYMVITDNPDIKEAKIEWPYFGNNEPKLKSYITFLNSTENTNHPGLWQNLVVFQHVPNASFMHVICNVNIPMIMKMKASGFNFTNFMFFWDVMDFIFGFSDVCLGNYPGAQFNFEKSTISQPPGFVENFTLSPYQLRTVSWLLAMENSSPKVQYYEHIVTWQTLQGRFYFDKESEIFVDPDKLHTYPKHTCAPKGGIIAKESGVPAVRAEIIGLLLATHQKNIKNNNKENEQKKSKEKTNGKIYTHATLILCFSPHVLNWQNDILQITTGLKVVTFDDMSNFVQATHQDILEADVVVVCPIARHPFEGETKRGKNKAKEEENTNAPTLLQFHWRRVVLDDSPALILNAPIFSRILTHLNAQNVWCVSKSTTFVADVLSGMATVVGCTPIRELVTKFLWKITRKSLEEAFPRHPSRYVFENIPLDLSPPEMYFYLSTNSKEIATMISCEITSTLDDTKQTLLAKAKDIIVSTVKKNPRALAMTIGLPLAIQRYACLYNSQETYKGPMTSAAIIMRHVSDSVLHFTIMQKEDIDEKTELYKFTSDECENFYYKYLLSDNSTSISTTPTITETKPKQGFSLLKLFKKEKENKEKESEKSEKSETENSNSNRSSPSLSRSATPSPSPSPSPSFPSPLAELSENTQKEQKERERESEIKEEEIIPCLQNQYGTKIAHLLLYLMKLWERDPSARVIIFIPLRELLRKIYYIMKDIGIGTGILVNRFAASKAAVGLSSTNEYPLRVFLTSEPLNEYASFGVSHIFFLHHLYSFVNQVQKPLLIEANKTMAACYPQGKREFIVVVRFFWRDSDEHDIVLEHKLVDIPSKSNKIFENLTIDAKSEIGTFLSRNGFLDFKEIQKLVI